MEDKVDKRLTQEAEKWLEYVSLVKKRDEARFKAEQCDKDRRAAWKEYYSCDRQIAKLNYDLGLNDVANSDNDSSLSPVSKLTWAPKKARK